MMMFALCAQVCATCVCGLWTDGSALAFVGCLFYFALRKYQLIAPHLPHVSALRYFCAAQTINCTIALATGLASAAVPKTKYICMQVCLNVYIEIKLGIPPAG